MLKPESFGITPAQFLLEDESLYSPQFDDTYASRKGAVEEKRYVFIEANGLLEKSKAAKTLTICELGFGTGLNFVLSWNTWRAAALGASQRLHYFSIEQHPFFVEDLERLLPRTLFSPDQGKEFFEQYPRHVRGFHRLLLDQGRVSLTLMFGEVRELLQEVRASVDIWYLDGFSPQKNPEMWTAEVFSNCFNLSAKTGASGSTYSSSTRVREGLEKAGFSVEKSKGFAGKREMLRFQRQTEFSLVKRRTSEKRRVVVVGGGLAGITVAEACARRNCQVVLLEKESELAEKASGNSAAVLMPYLSSKPDILSRFYMAGFLYTLRELSRLNRLLPGLDSHLCGVLRLITSAQLESVFRSLSELELPADLVCGVEQEDLFALTGVETKGKGLFHRAGGWIAPKDFVKAYWLMAGSSLEVATLKGACGVLRQNETWTVLDSEQGIIAEGDFVVFANAYDAMTISQLASFPLEKVRGQLMKLRKTEISERIRTIICYDGYIVPQQQDSHLVGATYEHNAHAEVPKQELEIEMLERMRAHLPSLGFESADRSDGRVCFRTMSPDRLPLIGPVLDQESFEAEFRRVNNRGFGDNIPSAGMFPGLFVSLGHGSRGVLSCPLAGEIVASLIAEEALPIEGMLLDHLHPARFQMRALKRAKTVKELYPAGFRWRKSE